MREQDAILSRRPLEHIRVGSSDQSCILHAHDIEIRSAAQQPAQDSIVEIFVGGKA
jgi:hypothetical protein